MDLSAEARAARGAEWLDAHFGDATWAVKIDLDKLDIADGASCVAGQLYGPEEGDLEFWGNGFERFSTEIMPNPEDLARNGFSSAIHLGTVSYGEQDHEFYDLTWNWGNEIAHRQEQLTLAAENN